jgi:hypothetical protein
MKLLATAPSEELAPAVGIRNAVILSLPMWAIVVAVVFLLVALF